MNVGLRAQVGSGKVKRWAGVERKRQEEGARGAGREKKWRASW